MFRFETLRIPQFVFTMNDIMNVGGEIYVQISFLKKYNVPEQTIYNGLSRFKQHRSKNYEYLADSLDKRKVWIRYRTLTSQLMKSYTLPTHDELILLEQNYVSDKVSHLVQGKLGFAFEHGYKAFVKHYTGIFFEQSVLESYARTHCLFSHCLELKQYGIAIKDIYPVYSSFAGLQFEAKSIKSFYHKLADYEKQGHRIFIHRSYGQARGGLKLTPQHIEQVEKLYRDQAQYSGRAIHEKLNLWAIREGYAKVHLSTVKQVLADTEFQNRNKPFRNGAGWKRQLFDPYHMRQVPPYNGALWQMDGSRLQIPYLKDGKPAFLNFFVVMDVHSRKIVGYSIDRSENVSMILTAIEMAVQNCGYVPVELVFDHSSSFKHKRFQHLEDHFSLLGTSLRKHAPGNPQDKAQVERFFSTFQTTICKGVPGYIGEGIKSRREEGRPADEAIQKALSKSNLRSEGKLRSLFKELIERYNQQSIGNKLSPNAVYESVQMDESVGMVSDNELALLFWNRIHDYQVKRSMILITEGSFKRQTYQYIIDDTDWQIRLNFKKVLVCYSKEDRSLVKLFDENEQHILNVKRSFPVPAVRKPGKQKALKTSIKESKSDPNKKEPDAINQLYKQPETLDLLFIKSKNNE